MFIASRQILYGVVANEVIYFAERKGKECNNCKADFEITYDSISWSFLYYMLLIFHFCEKCRIWMQTLHFFSGFISILEEKVD